MPFRATCPDAEARLAAMHVDPATGLYNVGVLRMSMKQYSEAASAFDQAASARPSLADGGAASGAGAHENGGAAKEQ